MPIPPSNDMPRHEQVLDWLHSLSLDLKLSTIDPQMMRRPINKLRMGEWSATYAVELAHCHGIDEATFYRNKDGNIHRPTLEFMDKLISHIEQGIDENDPLKYVTEWEIGEILQQAHKVEQCRRQLIYY